MTKTFPKSILKTKAARISEARERGPQTYTKRCEAAIKRNTEWQEKCPIDQLEYLDKLFGKNKGAAKQRAKINKIIKGQ